MRPGKVTNIFYTTAMEMTLTTPALVFPAITLLLLAYTNRFLATSSLIRSLYVSYKQEKTPILKGQIKNLRLRLTLIKYTQVFGIASLLLAVISISCILGMLDFHGAIAFTASLFCMIISLSLSLYETFISVDALKLLLSDMES